MLFGNTASDNVVFGYPPYNAVVNLHMLKAVLEALHRFPGATAEEQTRVLEAALVIVDAAERSVSVHVHGDRIDRASTAH